MVLIHVISLTSVAFLVVKQQVPIHDFPFSLDNLVVTFCIGGNEYGQCGGRTRAKRRQWQAFGKRYCDSSTMCARAFSSLGGQSINVGPEEIYGWTQAQLSTF